MYIVISLAAETANGFSLASLRLVNEDETVLHKYLQEPACLRLPTLSDALL